MKRKKNSSACPYRMICKLKKPLMFKGHFIPSGTPVNVICYKKNKLVVEVQSCVAPMTDEIKAIAKEYDEPPFSIIQNLTINVKPKHVEYQSSHAIN